MCDISRVADQNDISLLHIMLEIHHSGREPSICMSMFFVCFFFPPPCLLRFSGHRFAKWNVQALVLLVLKVPAVWGLVYLGSSSCDVGNV